MGMGKGVWFPTLVPLGFLGGLSELWHHYGYLVEMLVGAHSLQQTLTSLTATGGWLLRHPIRR